MVGIQGDNSVKSLHDYAQGLGIQFSDVSLLQRAVTHRSFYNEHPEILEDNERLEFLGDAVLDFLVGAWLYSRFPEKAEGYLTRLRSALVCTEQLADFARHINLGSIIRLGRGEDRAGGRERKVILCATFEALIGAIQIDAGIEKVQKFVEPMLEPAVLKILSTNKERDSKSLFQEWIQSQGKSPPVYETVSTLGPDHNKIFEVEVKVDGRVYGRGRGHSKQAAAKIAAHNALKTNNIKNDVD